MKRDFERTKEIISKVVSRFGSAVANSIMSREDLEQELWVKALQLEEKYWDKTDSEYFKLLITSLNNYARSIIRYYSSRPDTSWNSNYENLSSEDGPDVVNNVILKDDRDPYREVEVRVTLERIKEILKNTNLKYKHFIDEYLEFAQSEEWRRIQEQNPVYRAEEYPPITTFFKVKYGISGKRARDIMMKVRKYVGVV